MAVKKKARTDVFTIHKRSPDLSVMDYGIWKAVSTPMRRLELKFAPNKIESKSEYMDRLRKVAKSLTRALVRGAIEDMRRRWQRLHTAHGGHFRGGWPRKLNKGIGATDVCVSPGRAAHSYDMLNADAVRIGCVWPRAFARDGTTAITFVRLVVRPSKKAV